MYCGRLANQLSRYGHSGALNLGELMRLPDVLSIDELTKRWWIGWRSVDFSWMALERKYLGGDAKQEKGQTLQSYWRTDLTEGTARGDTDLINLEELEADPRGNLWHLVHVPLYWDDGTPTWKAQSSHQKWKLFWKLVRDRLQVTDLHVLGQKPANESSSANLSGIVFGDIPEDWVWHNVFEHLNAKFLTCAFLGRTSFSCVESISDLDFRHCLFRGTADFDAVNIKGDLRLDSATFLAHLSMERANIDGNLEMSDCNIYGELSLLNGSIKGKTRCTSSVFNGPCGFEKTRFWSEVNIAWCRFLNVTSFASVRFRGAATLLQNRFITDVVITGRCYGEFQCIDCELTNADLAFFFCFREAWFSASRFKGSALFQGVRFCGRTSFRNTVFESDVRFQQVRFKAETEFHNAVFEGVADFSGCRFPIDARFHHCAFRGADFRRTADFTMECFSAWGAFAECAFHQRVLFARQTLNEPRSFKVAFEAADQAVVVAGQNGDTRRAEIHRRFAELESAFQSLKQGMARQQARLDEHRFYRLELLARSRYSTARIESGMIWLYDISSGL